VLHGKTSNQVIDGQIFMSLRIPASDRIIRNRRRKELKLKEKVSWRPCPDLPQIEKKHKPPNAKGREETPGR
jgi:hypothetical protein